jgi:hypothetical protein
VELGLESASEYDEVLTCQKGNHSGVRFRRSRRSRRARDGETLLNLLHVVISSDSDMSPIEPHVQYPPDPRTPRP